jgi:hypothetical protein
LKTLTLGQRKMIKLASNPVQRARGKIKATKINKNATRPGYNHKSR